MKVVIKNFASMEEKNSYVSKKLLHLYEKRFLSIFEAIAY